MWNVMHKVIEFIQPRFALIYMIFQTPENGNFYHFQPHDAIWYQQQEREHDEDSRRIESDPRKWQSNVKREEEGIGLDLELADIFATQAQDLEACPLNDYDEFIEKVFDELM